MTIKEIKAKMLAWEDFYGHDISDANSIKEAKTKRDLAEVLREHKHILEQEHMDAIRDEEQFEREVGLFYI